MDAPRETARETVLQGAADSDPTAWLDRHGDVLFHYALWRVRSHDVAEELVQETLLAALRAHEGFAGRSSEQTWLVGILRRKVIDHYRASQRTPSGEGDAAADRAMGEVFDGRGHWRTRLGKWPAGPSRDIESKEFWIVLDGCLSKMPRHLADAFALREMEGLEAEEICKILRLSTSNLWTQLHRARILLRRCIETSWFARPG